MKTKLYEILLNNSFAGFYADYIMKTTDYYAKDDKDLYSIERRHRIIRNFWFRELVRDIPYENGKFTFREYFEKKYEKYSLKYWTPKARLNRIIEFGEE